MANHIANSTTCTGLPLLVPKFVDVKALETLKWVLNLVFYNSLLPYFWIPFTGDVMVSSMEFQLTSELNAPSPTFTVICTSTGGPATTVSWTSNSSAVTEDRIHSITSQITNTTTATYTHTLTVTRWLVGEYECNVSNNKPSSSSGVVAVVGKNYKYTDIFYWWWRVPREYFCMFTHTILPTASWSYSMSISANLNSLHPVIIFIHTSCSYYLINSIWPVNPYTDTAR